MQRIYDNLMAECLENERQMFFLAGPRQVGKTTCALHAERLTPHFYYLNWDTQAHKKLIIAGPDSIAHFMKLENAYEEMPIVVFDEIHKYGKWKLFLKGFFDIYGKKTKIIVTGSAKLDIYKRGGDSLMGRYFLYRMHPISIAEIVSPQLIQTDIRQPKLIDENQYSDLFTYGGFPEPFINKNKRFSTRWHTLRRQQLIREDIRALSQIHELSQLEMLTEILIEQTGQLVNYSSLASALNISTPTAQRWIKNLEAFYYCFTIKPWFKSVRRSLRKNPKIYLWDWSNIADHGAKCENFVASHLLKAVHFWTDYGLGNYELHFIRDKEQNEVDFLVTKDKKPWFLVEVKVSDNNGISKSLYQFQKEIKASHAFQVVFNRAHIQKDCFSYKDPVIVPVQTLLSQLV